MQFFWGMFLADLSNHPSAIEFAQKHDLVTAAISPVVIFTGLIMASYPEGKPEYALWSTQLHTLLIAILPDKADVPRFSSGLGLEFISLGILYNPPLKNLLSNRHLLWLGKNSFAVYLLHGTMLRVFLTWMLFGVTLPADTTDDAGLPVQGPAMEMRGPVVQALCIPIWFVGLYAVANYWTRYVDPFCARTTQRLESYVFEESAETAVNLPK